MTKTTATVKASLMKKIDGFDKYYISKEGEIMCTDCQRTGKCRMLKPQMLLMVIRALD